MQFCRTHTFLWLIISFLSFISTANADTSDWVQVERFKSQLQMAEQGNVKAMYNLALLYERGRGTDISFTEAVKWLKLAADANNIQAKARLGIYYVEGRGVEKDLAKALTLLKFAAEKRNASAQYQLGNMYETGNGVEVDLLKAIDYYKQAQSNGYYAAENKVKRLSAVLNGKPAAAAPAPKPAAATPKQAPAAPRSKIASVLQQGNWKRRNRPVAYLPSSISHCVEEDGGLKCVSTAQERNTGREILTYSTDSMVKNFKGKTFEIEYSNNILNVESNDQDRSGAGYEDGVQSAANSKSRYQTGMQSKVHKLNCTLENARRITCLKNNAIPYTIEQ